MFSKRHYEWFADWLANASLAVADIDRNLLASSLADRLERDNPGRFNRTRFLAACRQRKIAADWSKVEA